jgi:uncharacterized damage-inducible protein DinB
MNAKSDFEQCVLISSIVEILNQGERLLMGIDDESYVRKLPAAFNASIGGHYRHCLDHFLSLLGSAVEGDLNYDQRERNPLVENDRFAALNVTRAVRDQFLQLETSHLERTFQVTSQTSYALNNSPVSTSTVSREIMYVVAHAVHHYALIGMMGALMGLKLPPGFGVAPSTLKHQAAMNKD